MKRIKVLRANEAKVEPFVPESFTENEVILSSMEILEYLRSRSSKKAIRKMAQTKGIPFDEEKILFSKKIINIIVDEISNGK